MWVRVRQCLDPCSNLVAARPESNFQARPFDCQQGKRILRSSRGEDGGERRWGALYSASHPEPLFTKCCLHQDNAARPFVGFHGKYGNVMEESVVRDEGLRRKSPFRDQQSRRVVLTSRRKWLKRVRH